jgi:putative nucleotidyltransferase with HDIG domain
MKRVKLADLIPGMVTAEDIFTYNNQLILPKSTILSDKSITRLEFYSVSMIRIEDELKEVPEEDANEQPYDTDAEAKSYSEIIQSSPEFQKFRTDYDESVNDFKQSLNDIVTKGSEINVHQVLDSTKELFETGGNTFSFFHMLQNMRDYDDLTYAHCMNVALICHVFAGWMHFSPEDVETATLSGMFHDIGKLAIPDHIIKKPDKLTDEEFSIIKQHTIEGYQILQNQDINEHIKNAALMHHERCDGSGYPFGLTGNKIDKFAKLVSIADVYDAMTAARVYRGPLCPFSVIEIFEKEGLQRYESEYILCFLENVVMTYINNRVRLSNGLVGDIVFINRQQFSRPMVKCGDEFFDLSKDKSLSIVEIV